MFNVFIRNKEQYDVLSTFEIDNIYTDDLELAKEYNLYYQVPRYKKEINLPEHILVGDVGTIYEYKGKKKMVTDSFLNVSNHESIEVLLQNEVERVTLSIESTLGTITDILKVKDYPIEVIIYGRCESMLLKTHPLIKEDGYFLKDQAGGKYPIKVDEDKQIHILHKEILDRTNELEELKEIGVKHFRFNFFDETKEEIQNILSNYM